MLRIRTVWVALLATCAFGVGSCQSASPVPVGLRVLLRLAPDVMPPSAPGDTAAAVERIVSASARVPVTYVAASGSQWHAVLLQCDPDACEAALARLTADTTRFSAVQRDALRRP
jgi:hypothetical protein